jgi:hypothetical protein
MERFLQRLIREAVNAGSTLITTAVIPPRSRVI